MSSNAHRFVLRRTEDPTGVSGTGDVADGVQFDNGRIVLQWRGEHRSIVLWDRFESMLEIHGHDGATDIVWIDKP